MENGDRNSMLFQ